jgi:hypothetical protein
MQFFAILATSLAFSDLQTKAIVRAEPIPWPAELQTEITTRFCVLLSQLLRVMPASTQG